MNNELKNEASLPSNKGDIENAPNKGGGRLRRSFNIGDTFRKNKLKTKYFFIIYIISKMISKIHINNDDIKQEKKCKRIFTKFVQFS